MKFILLLLSIISLLHVTPNYAKENVGLKDSPLANIIKVEGRVKFLLHWQINLR